MKTSLQPIKGKGVTYETVLRLADLLNKQKPLPYFFDIVDYHSIYGPKLIEHVDRIGIVIFDRHASK